MLFFLLFILGFFGIVPSVFAHGTIWMGQYPNWMDGVQWWFVAAFVGLVAGSYFLFRYAVRKFQNLDLLDYGKMRQFVKSRWYPLIFQIPSLILFGFIVFYLFFGSYYYSENPGATLVWTFWWALLPVSFILIGRLWCAVCPFAWISDFVQKHFGKQRRVPAWLAKYSFWIVDGTFLFITWFDRVFGMTERPFITGLVFFGLFLGVVVCGYLYERRVFCRYVCFLGNVAGTYSMTAPFELVKKDPAVCDACKDKPCFFGAPGKPGCPFYQVMPAKEGNRFCTLCANCVKACSYDNIGFKLRSFGSDFWRRLGVRFEESFFAKMLVGIVILQNIGMLTLWNVLSDFVTRVTGITDERGLFTIVYVFTVSMPLLLMFFTSALSAKFSNTHERSECGRAKARLTCSDECRNTKETVMQNFARFGYAFVGVDLAGHLAHNLNHFFGEGKTILTAFAGLFSGNMRQIIFQWFLNYGTVRILQYFVLFLGVIGTFIITYRIARKAAGNRQELVLSMAPHLFLLAGLMVLNFYIFSLPMIHRSQNIF